MIGHRNIRAGAAAATTLAATVFGILLSTGVLMIGLAVVSAFDGQSIGDFLADAFPRFRGGAHSQRLPTLAYVVFFLYVVAAAQIAILARRALAGRGRR